ncbi:hypothetical protein NBRC10513v2_005955 [Rhodotorula toruloides]
MTESSQAVAATPDEERVESVASSETANGAAPAPKKSRTSTSAARKVGSLKDFLDLPMELVLRVLDELDLQTVFHLSRLNKRFWQLLRSDTDAMHLLWERARIRAGIPRLMAPGCDVYQYANLLFGCCRGCGKTTTKVDYVLRIRTCPKCWRTFITNRKDAPYDTETRDLTPSSNYDSSGTYRQTPHYLLPELEEVDSMIEEVEETRQEVLFLQKTCPEDLLPSDDGYDSEDSYLPDPNDPSWHLWEDIRRPAFVRSESRPYFWDVDNRQDFRDALEGLQRQRNQDAEDIFSWFRRQEEAKKAELEQLNLQRRQAIEARFIEAGWLPQHFKFGDWIEHPFMQGTKLPTESAINRVRYELESILAASREQVDAAACRRERARREALVRSKYFELEADAAKVAALGLDPLPNVVEFLQLEPVKAIYQVVSAEDIDQERQVSLEDHACAISAAVAAARAATRRALFVKMVELLADLQLRINRTFEPPEPAVQLLPLDDPQAVLKNAETYEDAVLSRASSLLPCRTCRRVGHTSHILSHRCEILRQPAPLNFDKYSVPVEPIASTLDIVRAADKDVTTTASEMDDLGAVFSCTCIRPAIVQDWLHMAIHRTQYHTSGGAYHGRANTDKELVCETRQEAMERLYSEASRSHPRLPSLLDADPAAGDAGQDLQDLVENALSARLARLRVDDPTSSLRERLVRLELKEAELPKRKARTVVRETSNVLTVQSGVLPKREWDTQQHRFQCDETPCIFTTAVDRTLKAYSLGTYELLDSFPLPSPCLSFAQHPLPQYRRFVACAMMDGSMAVLDLVTREVEAKVQDHTKYIVRVCWSPDGRHLATLGYDKLVRIYRIELSAPAPTSSSEPALFDDEAPDPLAVCPDVSLNLVHTIESRTNPEAAIWLPDSRWLVWSARDDHLLRYLRLPDDDAGEWQAEEVNLNENGDSFTSFSILSIGLHPTLPLLSLQTSTLSARILLYPFHSATRLLTLHTTASQSDYFNPRHAWLPSGAGVVVNSEDGLLRIVDLRGRVRVSQGAHGAAAPPEDGEEGLAEEVRSERARSRREADKGSSVIRDVEVLVDEDDKGSVTGWKVVSCGFDKTVKLLE